MDTYDYKVRRKDYDKESEYYYALFKQAKNNAAKASRNENPERVKEFQNEAKKYSLKYTQLRKVNK